MAVHSPLTSARFWPVAGLVTVAILLSVPAAQAITIDVPDDYDTIQEAINAASDGDVVVVQPGTWVEAVWPWRVRFFGKAITVRSTDPTNAAVRDATIITEPWGNSPVLFIDDEGNDSILEGFTITGGDSGNDKGGGIYCEAGPTIRYNNITGCHADKGAGIWVDKSTAPEMAIIEHNIIHDNDVNSVLGAQGGGIFMEYPGAVVRYNTITDNGGGMSGGGIYAYAFSYYASEDVDEIYGNTITGNSATAGGGIYVRNGMTIRDNVITGNSAYRGGGVSYYDTVGGWLIGNVITDNSATYGGGVYALDDPTLLYNTIANNTGRGVQGPSSVTVSNCILWGNDDDIAGCSATYSNIGDGDSGAGNISTDPQFADAANYDYHLKSKQGRWTSGGWVKDSVSSPSIDRADPTADYANEPAYNGGRANQGAYGNTPYASKSNRVPTDPTSVSISPASPKTGDDLAVSASGGTDADGDSVTYVYQWAQSTDGGSTWGSWGNDGDTLDDANTAKGEQWKARGRSYDGTDYSNWVESSAVTVVNTAPTQPTVDVTPNAPGAGDGLSVLASGSTDADSDTVTFTYRWTKDDAPQGTYDDQTSVPSSATSKGEVWKCVATPSDGTDDGPTGEDSVTVVNTPPTAPTVDVTPDSPKTLDGLSVSASGSTDADSDTITYSYAWYKNDAHQAGYDDQTSVPSSATSKGEVWKCVVTPNDGTDDGSTGQDSVTVGNTAPGDPTSVTVSPLTPLTDDDLTAAASGSTDADGDSITHEYQWAKSTDGGTTWGSWGNDGDTLDDANTTKGEKWKARARSYDGTDYSAWLESDPVTIGNTAPTAPAVDVTPNSLKTGDDLSVSASGSTDADGDTVTYSYRWYKDDVHQASYDDQTSVPSSATSKGEAWKCVVTPNDGTDDGPTGEDSVTVANTAPTAPTVDVTPDSPETGDGLSVSASGSTDADGDTVTYSYAWYKDDAHQAGYDDQTSVPSSATSKGEVWKCVVTPNDGTDDGPTTEDSVTVDNTAPTAPTVDVTPDGPETGDGLSVSASGSTDADGDAVTYSYRWYRDDAHQASYDDQTSVPSSATSRGEIWKCVVTPHDGTDDGSTGEDSVTIGNTAPTAPSVDVTPASPKTDDDLAASASGSTDADGDSVSYECQWAKSIDGGTTWGAWGNAGDTLDDSNTAKGEKWRARARAFDGTEYSDWVESDPVAMGNTSPTAPTVDVTPNSPNTGDDLSVSASGSTDADSDTVTYSYAWYKDDAHQAGYDDQTSVPSSATSKGEVWKCVVTPNDGTDDGSIGQDSVTIGNTGPGGPTSVTINPLGPLTNDDLTSAASGSADADGDSITHEYQWARSTDGGTTWGAWGNAGDTLDSSNTTRGEQWKARARAFDGTEYSEWVESDPVAVSNTTPGEPTSATISPSSPLTDDDLVASASGSTDADGDSLAYEYQWAQSTDGGSTWGSWGNDGDTLDDANTAKGEKWKARARSYDGTDYSAWLESGPVTIGNTTATLTWLGTAGYGSDGVDPAEGQYPLELFTFRVIYTDIDGGLPTYCRLVLDREGNTRVFNMRRGSGNTTTGRQFLFRRRLAPGLYRYRIEAHDGDEAATGTPTGWIEGPVVCPRQNGRPDGLIWDGERWLGDNWYNTTGAKQRVDKATAPGGTVTYSLKLQNDRSDADTLLVMGPPSKGVWQITYEDAVGSDITAAVTQDGWVVPELAASGETTLTVRITAADDAPSSAWKAVLVQVGRTAWGPTKNAESADTVKMMTTIEGDASDAAASTGPQVTGLVATQTNMGVELRFTLTVSAQLQARVLNLAGRPVKTLCTMRDCEPGTNTLIWNATSDQGLVVPNGTYLVEVSARSADGLQARALGQVQVRR